MMIVMFRRMLCMLLLCLLWVPAYGEEASPPIVNLIASPEASFHLDDQAQLLTIVYPNIHGSDCCILMYGGEVWMVDCSTDDQATALVVPVLEKLGVTQVDTAFNSHPHNDHITGFEYIGGQANIHTLMIAFDSRYNAELRRTLHRLGSGVQTVRVHDGQVLTMGDGGVTLTVIQREGTGYTTNDLSALLKVTCGERSILMAGDIENRGQRGLLKDPPACGVQADILKYPHHGHDPMNDALFDQIQPALAIVTAHELPAREGFAYLARKGVPGLSTWYGCIRLRTDGHIWVVDAYPCMDMN